MAFFGILILSWVFMMIFLFIIAVIVFVFIPALTVSIINLILGIKHHWPKTNVVLLSVFGSITILLLIIGLSLALILALSHTSNAVESESVETVILILNPLFLLS